MVNDAGQSSFVHELRVPYADVDQMGYVYYANYLVYFEMARSHLLRGVGLPYAELEQRGFMLPVIEAHCDYSSPAHYDDLLEVRTQSIQWQGARLRIGYDVVRTEHGTGADVAAEGDLICSGHTVHAFTTLEGRPVRPIPELKNLTINH